MRYGLPFMGSKSRLAEKIVAVLPRAKHLYDIFGGGCAISHAALLSGKWECVHFSDISNSVELFRDCLEGNIPDGSEWISREEFFRRIEEPYVRLLWSFGNNGRDYLYSKEIEPFKKAVHEMIFAPTPNERRLKFREVCTAFSPSNLSYPPPISCQRKGYRRYRGCNQTRHISVLFMYRTPPLATRGKEEELSDTLLQREV